MVSNRGELFHNTLFNLVVTCGPLSTTVILPPFTPTPSYTTYNLYNPDYLYESNNFDVSNALCPLLS